MRKKQFKAESKRLLDLMINSIYTHKEIFLREIISNASDAIDKLCYRSLTDDKVGLTRDQFEIRLSVDAENRLLTVSETGYGRKSNFDDYRVQSRAGKGLINYHTETYGKVAMIAPVREDQDIIMISQEGIVIRTPVDQISAFKRPAKGVRVMRTTDEDKVVTLSVVEHMEPEKTDDTPEGDGTETPVSAPETAE